MFWRRPESVTNAWHCMAGGGRCERVLPVEPVRPLTAAPAADHKGYWMVMAPVIPMDDE